MKTCTPALANHMQQPTTSLCRLLKVTRNDGTIYRYTDHDQPLTFTDGMEQASTPIAAIPAVTPLEYIGPQGLYWVEFISGAAVTQSTTAWTVSMTVVANGSYVTLPIDRCFVFRTMAGSKTVLDCTQILFGGLGSFTLPLGVQTSDVMAFPGNAPVDTLHDYYFFIEVLYYGWTWDFAYLASVASPYPSESAPIYGGDTNQGAPAFGGGGGVDLVTLWGTTIPAVGTMLPLGSSQLWMSGWDNPDGEVPVVGTYSPLDGVSRAE